MDGVCFFGMLFEIGAVIFALSLLKKSRWALFCETLDHVPENVRRLARWRWRRILRAWDRLRAACLQCHLAGERQFRIKNFDEEQQKND